MSSSLNKDIIIIIIIIINQTCRDKPRYCHNANNKDVDWVCATAKLQYKTLNSLPVAQIVPDDFS